MLRGLQNRPDANLLVGSASSDDAAIYRIDEERALVQTLDFFTPIVDDPYTYGQIAAANSLSDVYAMGGRPLTAMNIVAVPDDLLFPETINQILRGGADKVAESGAVLAGGHTVKNPEPLYGLSVTGLVHPQHYISNSGGKTGDLLVLTKPLGTGIVSTALKHGLHNPDLEERAVRCMTALNTPGTALAEAGYCVAGTDITGFGLLGHLAHLCRESHLSARLDTTSIPALSEKVFELIGDGVIPGGTKNNLKLASVYTSFDKNVEEEMKYLLADAQTSGGLLLAIPPKHLDAALAILEQEAAAVSVVIGELIAPENKAILCS